MRVTIIPIVIGAFRTVTKGLLEGLEDLKVGGRVETIQTTALLRTARILRSVLETWGDLLSFRLQGKNPSVNVGVKIPNGIIIKIIIIIIIIIIIRIRRRRRRRRRRRICKNWRLWSLGRRQKKNWKTVKKKYLDLARELKKKTVEHEIVDLYKLWFVLLSR